MARLRLTRALQPVTAATREPERVRSGNTFGGPSTATAWEPATASLPPGPDFSPEPRFGKRLQRLEHRAEGSQPDRVPPIVTEVLRSPGQPLDPASRAFMEPRFGYDFGQVRVHADSRAGQSARAVHALAYTVGSHIVFGPGRYPAQGPSGKGLLAHELTHVVQQAGGAPLALQRQPDDAVEGEFEEEGRRFREARRRDLGRVIEGMRFRKVPADCARDTRVRLTDVLAATASRMRGNRACLEFFRRQFNVDPLPFFDLHRDPTFTVMPQLPVSGRTRCPRPAISIQGAVCTSPLRERVIAHELTHYAGCLTPANAPCSEELAHQGENICIGTVREVLDRHRAAQAPPNPASAAATPQTATPHSRLDRFADPNAAASPLNSPLAIVPASVPLEQEAEHMADEVMRDTANPASNTGFAAGVGLSMNLPRSADFSPQERQAGQGRPCELKPALRTGSRPLFAPPAASWLSKTTFPTLQRRVQVENPGSPAGYLPPPDNTRPRAELVEGWLRQLCPSGQWMVNRSTGEVGATNREAVCGTRGTAAAGSTTPTPISCDCLCQATSPQSRLVRIRVAEDMTYDVFEFDRTLGINRLRTDTETASGHGEGFTVFPEEGAWLDAATVVLSGRSTTLAGVGDTNRPGARRISDPPWIILGHEICGHLGVRAARGSEGYGHVETPAGDRSAVDIENRIRREHSTATRSLGIRGGDTGGIEGGLYILGPGETFESVSLRLGMTTGAGAFDQDGLHRRIHHWPSGDRIRRSDFTALFTAGTELFIEGIHWHPVIAGEAWATIAAQWGIPTTSLRRANPGVTPTPGLRLLIPVR